MRSLSRVQLALVVSVACAAGYAIWRTSVAAHEPLIATASNTRVMRARLSGFPWAPYSAARDAGATRKSDLRLAAAAASILAKGGDDDAESLRQRAAAHLILGQTADAVEVIETAVRRSPSDVLAWNDAAAIFLASATAADHPEDFPRALAAVDRALRLDGDFAEARFNRALILEEVGLLRQAAAAWRHYLLTDSMSEWATEAREYLAESPARTRSESFNDRLPELTNAALHDDLVTVRRLVREFRQQARTTAEVELLGRWAHAEQAGDAAAAVRALETARAIALVVREERHEHLLEDAVHAVDAARGPDRTRLAEAHVLYQRGRQLHAQKRPEEAEPILRRAAARFGDSGSPMSLVARYYVGSALAAMHRATKARALLLELREQIPSNRYRALDAQIHWELGLTAAVTGDWGGAMDAYDRAAATFLALGENANLAFIRNLIAEAADYLGDRDAAWRHRRELLAMLSAEGTGNRLQVSIGTAARSELRARRYDTAVSLLQIEIDEASAAPPSEGLVLAYASRARALTELNERGAATADLHAARVAAVALKDPILRQTAGAAVDLAEAQLERETAPARALQLLSRAQESYEKSARRLPLPYVWLERGRTLRLLNAGEDAVNAFLTGIQELERQRMSVADYDRRVGVFDAGEPLFVEAADLLVSNGRFASAFELLDRSRGRSITDSAYRRAGDAVRAGPAIDAILAAIPSGTVVIEYAVLPERLVLFVLTRERLETHVVKVAADTVRAAAIRLATAVRQHASLQEVELASDDAAELLLEPASVAIRQASTLIFVPDRFLQLVPFAALRHDGSFVIERSAVAVSPSAALLLVRRPASSAVPRLDALVFGNPSTSGQMSELPGSAREARAIAREYPRASIATGAEATRERFLRDYGHALVVHFAGHAAMEPAHGSAAALAFAGAGQPVFVRAHEIARTAPLVTRLVVLAACDTFAGTRVHFEGTPTLAHAFLAAGVQSVAGSLWPLDDAAALQLFRRFHTQLRAGTDPAAALRDAQLALLHGADARLHHPANWAGVELLGYPLYLAGRAVLRSGAST